MKIWLLSVFVLTLSWLNLYILSLDKDEVVEANFYEEVPIVIASTTPSSTEIILTGDVMLGRTVMTRSLDMGDPVYPFRKVADALASADISFINLENPIVENCPRHTTGFVFCADPKMAQGLTFAGIDIANLANNHSYNYGPEGFEETRDILSEMQVKTVGADNLEIIERNGIRFGFIGFDLVVNEATGKDLELIKRADSEVDVLIVAVHWGHEYKSVANDFQRRNARLFVEAGADVVVGHHPHWVQDHEYIDGKPVYYSLGNFIFDQMWSEETKKGMVIRLTFEGSEIVEEELMPIYMSSWAQPEFIQ